MSKSVKSTDGRTSLKTLLREVWENQSSVNILLDGKPVAVLTVDPPENGTPPLRIRLDDARKGWSQLLNFVNVMGARYFFRIRFAMEDDETQVGTIYLLRHPEHRNRFAADWKEHRNNFRAEQQTELTTEDVLGRVEELDENMREQLDQLQDRLDEIKKSIGTAFASLTRPGGNPLNVPELGTVPLRSAYDLDDGAPD